MEWMPFYKCIRFVRDMRGRSGKIDNKSESTSGNGNESKSKSQNETEMQVKVYVGMKANVIIQV